jgi:hypothetical protein
MSRIHRDNGCPQISDHDRTIHERRRKEAEEMAGTRRFALRMSLRLWRSCGRSAGCSSGLTPASLPTTHPGDSETSDGARFSGTEEELLAAFPELRGCRV